MGRRPQEGLALADLQAPRVVRPLEADAEEGQGGLGGDERADGDRRVDDDRRDGVREDVADEDPQRPGAEPGTAG